MTDGPGQQPPQEPRANTPEGGREVLEGRIIPSRQQRAQEADPRQRFRRQSPPPQAPAAGPAWTPQADPAAAQPDPQAQGWAPQQPPQAYGNQSAPQQATGPQAHGRTAPQSGGPQQSAQGAPQVPFQGGGLPPRRNGGSGGGPEEPATPDWSALAERQESGARRRRVLMLTGGIVAVAVVAGGVATAVVMSGKSGDKPVADPSGSVSSTAQASLPPVPSFSSVAPPPPANPLDYLKSRAKDKAPISAASLFPGKQFLMNGRTYAKTTTAVTTKCATGARGPVAQALTANGCQKLIRATYTQGSLAVTIGIAVFADDKHAAKLHSVAQYVAPLDGGGIADFCHAVRCQMTSNSVGRYAYFTISGMRNGTTLAANDTVGKQAANDASNFAFLRIVQRGKDAAAADPSRR